MTGYLRYKAEDLRVLAAEVFGHLQLPPGDARLAAEVLVDADLRGIDSHGIAHLPAHRSYAGGLQKGIVNPHPDWKVVRETPTTALVDGDGGLGLLVAHRGMELAIEKGSRSGIGMVSVTNSRHFGAAGYYAAMALPHDMIGLAMTNTPPVMVPTFGVERRLGSNAMSFAAPTDKEPPYVLDMASTAVAVGKLEIARRKGEAIPQGWAIDGDGNPTNNPNSYWEGGGLLPLGSSVELSNHKGYGLAILVDILSGVLSGAGFGALLSRETLEMSHFFGAIRVDAFRPVDEFKTMMDEMLATLKATPTLEGEERVLVPGQKEHETFLERSRLGIPLHPNVVDSLAELAGELGIRFPEPLKAPV